MPFTFRRLRRDGRRRCRLVDGRGSPFIIDFKHELEAEGFVHEAEDAVRNGPGHTLRGNLTDRRE
ncbi:hypothetical protein ACQQ60_11170 [Corynebacterium diphtheriae]